MKKILCIILVLVMIMGCVCGCTDRKEPIYLIEASYGEGDEQKMEGFKRQSDYGVNTSSCTIIKEDIDKEIIPSFSDGASFEYKRTLKHLKTNIDGEYGEFYCGYDVYHNEEKRTYIIQLEETDFICAYGIIGFEPDSNLSKNYTEEEARGIGLNYLYERLDQETIDKYTYDRVSTTASGNYKYYYVRMIEGYRTDDIVTVIVSKTGELVAYTAYQFQKFDKIKGTFSKSDISHAEKKLEEKIAGLELENWKITGTELITNTSGRVFLRMIVECGPEKFKETYRFVASVN